jgi:hypothetical protein
MRARYHGSCRVCYGHIRPGEEISRVGGPGNPFLHARCAQTGSSEKTVQCKAGWTVPDESKPEGYRRVQCPNEIPIDRLTGSKMCAACSDS